MDNSNPMSGTSIRDLYNKQQNNYTTGNNMYNPYMQQYNNTQQPAQQPQQFPQQSRQNNIVETYADDDIDDIMEDIDEKEIIKEQEKPKSNNIPESTMKNNKNDKNIMNSIPLQYHEYILLLTIYIIMSNEHVRTFFGTHIKQLNPREDCTVSSFGVLIYGLILVVLFKLCKTLLFKF